MLAEVAPLLVPQVDGLLVSMLAILGCVVAIGIVSVLHHFTRAIVGGVGGLLGHIPGIGKVLSSPVNAVAHWIDHEFGIAESFLDATFAWWLHSLAELAAWLGREIREQANLLYLLATTMLGPAAMRVIDRAIDLLHSRAAWAEHVIQHELGRLHRLEQQMRHAAAGYIAAGIATALRPFEHELDSIERWIGNRGRALEHAVAGTIPREFAGMREWVRELGDRYVALFHRVGRLEHAIPTDVATAAVAVGLAELGLEWTRCRNVGRLGRRMCGTPAWLLEQLLAGAIDVLVIRDLCAITGAMIEGAHLAAPVLDELVSGIEELLSCQGSSRPPALKLHRTALPPVLETIDLAGGV
jgi:hypothetical protein